MLQEREEKSKKRKYTNFVIVYFEDFCYSLMDSTKEIRKLYKHVVINNKTNTNLSNYDSKSLHRTRSHTV